MKTILEKALTIGSIITPFAIVSKLIYDNDCYKNNFNAYCQKLEVLWPNRMIETDSLRITFFHSRFNIEFVLLGACVAIPISTLLVAEGIISPTNLNVVITVFSACILACRDSYLVENLNNQQITQESFDISGDETSSELQELEASEAIIML